MDKWTKLPLIARVALMVVSFRLPRKYIVGRSLHASYKVTGTSATINYSNREMRRLFRTRWQGCYMVTTLVTTLCLVQTTL